MCTFMQIKMNKQCVALAEVHSTDSIVLSVFLCYFIFMLRFISLTKLFICVWLSLPNVCV